MKLMQINLQEAYTKLHTMRPLKKGNLDLLLRRVAYNVSQVVLHSTCYRLNDIRNDL
jgi:hypothetical protein